MTRHLTWIALAAAAALVLVLGRQNQALRTERTALVERATGAYAGMWVPVVGTATLDGAPVRLGEPARGEAQLLYFFTTTCGYCRASAPALKQVAARLGKPVRMIAVTAEAADTARRYAREHALPFPVASVPDRRVEGLFRARAVPLLTVVNADGRATYTRLGELAGKAAIDSVVRAAAAATTTR